MAGGKRYTVVQHSGFGYSGKCEFQRGLEPVAVGKGSEDRVRRAGGVLFDGYAQADQFARVEMYPKGHVGLLPAAPGEFARSEVQGLRVYVPTKKS
ncbi:hypothetical protein [Micromonospora sp. NPDC047730]|uniref:hypothetical protein n=1 Tax=Micromonospora sp. NPDC047730 TaxID=3364253 RepID=UPI003720F699